MERKVRILVVDDEVDIAKSAAEVIERLVPNCEAEWAPSCAGGLAALSRAPFDAVVVDYRMPDKSGLEFIRRARDLEPGLPIVLMTAYASMDVATQAINVAHVDAFLRKPVHPEALARAITAAIGGEGEPTAVTA